MLFELCDIFGVSIDDFFPSQNETLQSPTTSPIQTIYDELNPPRQVKVLNYAERQLKEQRKRRRKQRETKYRKLFSSTVMTTTTTQLLQVQASI